MTMPIAAALLLLAALTAWFVAGGARPAARVYLRFAIVLFAALPTAALMLPSAATAVTLLILPLALTILALATVTGFARPPEVPLAASLLAVVCLLALAAAATGLAFLSLAPALGAAIALALLCVKHRSGTPALQGLASGLAFLSASAVFAIEGPKPDLLLFAAAGVLGAALALGRSDARVEQHAGRDPGGVAIGGAGKR